VRAVVGLVGTGWVGAGAVTVAVGPADGGPEPESVACSGWLRTMAAMPRTTRTAAQATVNSRAAPRLHFTGERYRADPRSSGVPARPENRDPGGAYQVTRGTTVAGACAA